MDTERTIETGVDGLVTEAEIAAVAGRGWRWLICIFRGHSAHGAEVRYCGQSYTYRCQQCGRGVREWWS